MSETATKTRYVAATDLKKGDTFAHNGHIQVVESTSDDNGYTYVHFVNTKLPADYSSYDYVEVIVEPTEDESAA